MSTLRQRIQFVRQWLVWKNDKYNKMYHGRRNGTHGIAPASTGSSPASCKYKKKSCHVLKNV
jgi:hypothetical protein